MGCFAIYFGWLFVNELLLSQLQPVFFLNKLDLTRNILMFSDLQHAVMAKHWLQLLLDIVYIVAPLALLLVVMIDSKLQQLLAFFLCIFNFVYAMTISSMSVLSIEAFMGWILIPLIFAWRSDANYRLTVEVLRYFFILIFASAALWKIRGGGIFYPEQMAGILLKQHTALLVDDPTHWFSRLVFFMCRHFWLSWSLYAIATLVELFFLVGFFTKKYDMLLIILFIGFVLFNYFFMRINYFSWVAFIGCFWFAGERVSKMATRDVKAIPALKGTPY